MNIRTGISIILVVVCACKGIAQNEGQDGEQQTNPNQWKLVLKDKGTKDWKKHWTLDGAIAEVENTKKGMHFSAGPEIKNDAHHGVLWTKESYSGDLKIEYEYTRTDTENRWVTILYIQATGDGEGDFVPDISKWSKLREVPSMRTYFEHMNLLHISYAAFDNSGNGNYYVRARRYPKLDNNGFDVTKIKPSYNQKGYFKSGQTYHITVIKTTTTLQFKRESKDGTEVFTWDLSDTKPIDEGRIGLRHMFARSAIYRNFKVYTKKNK